MRPETIRRTVAGLGLGAALLLVAACGSDSGSTASDPTSPTSSSATESPSMTPSETAAKPAIPAGTPDCQAVWVTGKDLKASYAGCADGDTFVKAHKVGCSSGQTYVLYGDDYWAVKGGTIKYAAKGWAHSPQYRKDIATCRG